MGAGQSSTTQDSQADGTVKTSYYEILSVSRHSTDDEIKKAYRRKALELHPDRNYGNEEEATRTFAEVQAAYEILSDPQERAWYDSHESAILRGDDGASEEVHSYQNVRVTTADDLARLLRKFNKDVDFSDSPSGFFGFLNEQFAQLAKEEEIAASWDNLEAKDYPSFGNKDDTHDDVVKKFYAAWTSFSTMKTFAWKDKYRLAEAPDRRIRRLMEKENLNLRQEAIREFNEAVRSFVLFVRKRDPRFTPSTQSEAERQKLLRDAAAAQAARARAANLAALQGDVPAWTQYRDPEELVESSEDEPEEEVIECVACNKTFKSEHQFEAHERSKKHHKAIQALQRQMRKDNAKLELDGSKPDAPVELDPDDGVSDIRRNSAADTTRSDLDLNHTEMQPDDRPDSAESSAQDSDSESQAGTAVEESNAGINMVVDEMDNSTLLDSIDSDPEQNTSASARKIGKAAQKRAKKAAAAIASTELATSSSHTCAGCNATFPSRTRLFQHIKDHGHAALKQSSTKSKKGKKKG